LKHNIIKRHYAADNKIKMKKCFLARDPHRKHRLSSNRQKVIFALLEFLVFICASVAIVNGLKEFLTQNVYIMPLPLTSTKVLRFNSQLLLLAAVKISAVVCEHCIRPAIPIDSIREAVLARDDR
jgi:hypothetical protein